MLALVAIVVPVTIIAVLGYASLRQWEASSDLLFHEQARDMAAMAAEKVTMMLRQAEEGFLDRLQQILSAQERPGSAAEVADAVVAELEARFPEFIGRAFRPVKE